MLDQDEIAFDPRSGRPEAPISWKVAPLEVAIGWGMAALLLYATVLTARDGYAQWALLSLGTAAFIAFVVERRRRQIRRAKLKFAELLEAYERTISGPV